MYYYHRFGDGDSMRGAETQPARFLTVATTAVSSGILVPVFIVLFCLGGVLKLNLRARCAQHVRQRKSYELVVGT